MNFDGLRADASNKLAKALNTKMLTPTQKSKIYQVHFDEFITKPSIDELKSNGWIFMGEKLSQYKLPQPVPPKQPKA